MGSPEGQEPWKPLVSFLIHVVTGSVIFLAILAAAVGLGFATKWVENNCDVDWVVIAGMRFLKYALYASDFYLLMSFIFTTIRQDMERVRTRGKN